MQEKIVVKTNRKYVKEKMISLGFEAEREKLNVPVGNISFEDKERALKEGGRMWYFADIDTHPKKVGYEIQTWVNLGILESNEDGTGMIQLHEKVGIKDGVVYGA